MPTDRRPDSVQRIAVTVAFSPAAEVLDEVLLHLPAGSTVADALRGSALAERHPGMALALLPCGVWGRVCSRSTVLSDGDRVELYRPLQVDPMEARRKRQSLQRGKVSDSRGSRGSRGSRA